MSVKVGYIVVVFKERVKDKAANHLMGEIVGEIMSYPSVDSVKCNYGVLGDASETRFWEGDDRSQSFR